jgi:hypothetical protein
VLALITLKSCISGMMMVFLANPRDAPRTDVELSDLRGEPGSRRNQLNRFRALLQAGIHLGAWTGAIAVKRVRGQR